MERPQFINLDLRNVDFRCRDLATTIFRGCDLRHADFRETNLEGAWFLYCDLRGTNFETANMINGSTLLTGSVYQDTPTANMRQQVDGDQWAAQTLREQEILYYQKI